MFDNLKRSFPRSRKSQSLTLTCFCKDRKADSVKEQRLGSQGQTSQSVLSFDLINDMLGLINLSLQDSIHFH